MQSDRSMHIITTLSNVTHAKMPMWYRPEMKRMHKVYYPPKKGLLPRQRGWNYCLPAVYYVFNGHCKKPAKVYTLENSRPIVRKTFQITIVMYIHEYKQISLEIIFLFHSCTGNRAQSHTHMKQRLYH